MARNTQTIECPTPFKLVRGLYTDHFIAEAPSPRRVQTFASGPSAVRQEFGHEADINNVILRFTQTGELPPRLNPVTPDYADVSEMPDLQTALHLVADAEAILAQVRADSAAKRAANPDPVKPPAAPAAPPVTP